MIYEQTGDWDIEDFWLPYFCVSTNLTSGQTRVHRSGNSAWAIRASVSIPGVLPPVPADEDLLVDGGVLNNLPVDIMRTLNPAGILVASDVSPPRALPAQSDFGLSVSGWRQALRNLFRPRNPAPVPGIAGTLVRSMMVGSELTRQRVLNEGLADFYLNTDVRDVGMLQFDAVQQAAEAGYREQMVCTRVVDIHTDRVLEIVRSVIGVPGRRLDIHGAGLQRRRRPLARSGGVRSTG